MKLIRNAVWLILVVAFVVSSCSILDSGFSILDSRLSTPQQHPASSIQHPGSSIADYASKAIEATAGLDAWMKTEKLTLDGVVTIYQPDNGLYLTEHHFEVYPWSNSIRISATEPLSRFVWQLSEGRLRMLEGDVKNDISPRIISYRDYAEVILTLITAPVRFLDNSVNFIKAPAPVKMEGLWYYPIEQTYPVEQAASSRELLDIAPIELYWPKVVFFQNTDSSLVDRIWFVDADEKKFLAVRGYDYKGAALSEAKGSKKDGVLVPTKIEIFRSDARAVLRHRMIKIDVK